MHFDPHKGTVTQKRLNNFYDKKNCVYSAKNLKFYMCFKYKQEKLQKWLHYTQIMLFVGL